MEKIVFAGQTYYLSWHKTSHLPDRNITQVSGYIFNKQNKLLIVRSGKNWTIPGGKPENNETPLETLKREIFEESGITIHTIRKIGHVKVLPARREEDIHFQLRYIAYVDQLLPFSPAYETSDRKFVNLDDLGKYISWHDSEVFQLELKDAVAALSDNGPVIIGK